MPKFDVAVLGAGIAGLSVAARAAQSGKNIVLVDPSRRSGGAVAPLEKDGFVFTAGPNAVYGLEPGGELRKLFSLIGCEQKEVHRPARYQVVLPDRRITISSDQQETLDELHREFPRDFDRLVALYNDAGKMIKKVVSSRLSKYVADRRSALSYLEKYRLAPEVLAFIAVQTHYFFGEGLSTLSLYRLLLVLSTPPAQFSGGFNRLAALIVSRIKEQNATMIWNEPWPLLHSRGRKAYGIKTVQGLIEARRVFINAPFENSEQVLFLGIHEDVLPVRMERTVLCITDYRAPEKYYSLSIAPRGEGAPANHCALSAVFPVADAHITEDEQLGMLQNVIPFLGDFTRVTAAQDFRARMYTMPDAIGPRIYSSRTISSLSGRKTFKNVLLTPDSSRTLFSSTRDAHQLALQFS